MEFQIKDNRVYAKDGEKLLAEVTFPNRDASTVVIDHTFVDDSLRGRGVANELLQLAVKQITEKGWKVIPTCSYAVAWFSKHPEFQHLLQTKD